MTTNLDRSTSKTRDRHPDAPTRRTPRPQVGGTADKVVRAAKEGAEDLKGAFKGPEDEAGSGEEDAQTERDDPTFKDTEANTSGSPLTYGSGDVDEDEGSKGT